jgi:hypothetical protein
MYTRTYRSNEQLLHMAKNTIKFQETLIIIHRSIGSFLYRLTYHKWDYGLDSA